MKNKEISNTNETEALNKALVNGNSNLRMPEHFEEFDGEELMSNFDGKIVEATAKAIKGKELFSRYAGWNFNGKVWWDANSSKWCCEVWCYRSWSATIIEDELTDIRDSVSERWGAA